MQEINKNILSSLFTFGLFWYIIKSWKQNKPSVKEEQEMKNLWEIIAVIKGKAYVAGIIPAENYDEAIENGKKYYGKSVVGCKFYGVTY